ncbi:MAG: hypothetical protein Q8L52_01830 [bacterium]|nr:hypothetical protein [bacterium]
MSEKSGAAPLRVLAEITELLAAITPEQFVAPTNMPREEDMHAVATATDDIKRLCALRDSLITKHNTLSNELNQLVKSLLMAALDDPLKTIEELGVPNSPSMQGKAQVEQLDAERTEIFALIKIVVKILWLEVRRQHPDLASNSRVCICDDWSLCWEENKSEDEFSAEIIGRFLAMR